MVITPLPLQQTPFHRQPAFIAGMVIIGIVLIFVILGGLLCCIQPRSDAKYQVRAPSKIPLDVSPSRKPGGYQRFDYPGEEHVPVTGSWSPGDPTWVSSTRKSPEDWADRLNSCTPKIHRRASSQMFALCKLYLVAPTPEYEHCCYKWNISLYVILQRLININFED